MRGVTETTRRAQMRREQLYGRGRQPKSVCTFADLGHEQPMVCLWVRSGPFLVALVQSLQLATPILMMLNGEIGSAARANVAMTVMLCLGLPEVVFGRERELFRQ